MLDVGWARAIARMSPRSGETKIESLVFTTGEAAVAPVAPPANPILDLRSEWLRGIIRPTLTSTSA